MPTCPFRLRSLSAAVLVASSIGLVSATASADAPSGETSRKLDNRAASADPSQRYRDACTQGNAKYVAHDFPGAIEAYRKAIELEPKSPLAHYLLGEAQLASGNPTDADAAWNRAALESGDKDPALRARILFVLADLRERQKKWDDARAAWQVYLDWVAKYPKAGGFPASGQARQQAIDIMLSQEKAYQLVRQRIADTRNGNVFTDVSKSPPGAAK